MNQHTPNLVFLFADQLRYQSCGFAGDTRAHTPNLDRLAAQGCNFTNAVSVYPLCGPFRASLLTGKYPTSTGMYRNDVRCMPDENAIGHVLKRNGYHTAYIGKWHLYCRNETEQFTPPGPYRLGFDDYWASFNWNNDYWNGFYYNDIDQRISMKGFQEDFSTDLALEFLDNRDPAKPFAIFLSYEAPHPPLSESQCRPEDYAWCKDTDFSDLLYATAEVFEKFEPSFSPTWQAEHIISNHQERCRAYYAMTACVDRNVGRLLNYLDAHNLSENTIVVFTSDHGEMLGAHGRIQKRMFFEESVRVPFLLRWRGTVQPDSTQKGCLNTPDIMPTLLELLGLPIPFEMEGYSFAKLALGISQANQPEYAFMLSMMEGKFNHHEEWRGIRDRRLTYVKMQRSQAEFLFDHQTDPRELNNLSEDPAYQQDLNHYRSILDAERKKRNDDFHPSEWYGEHWVQDGFVVRSATRKLFG
jgi:arylsulfatase A-like enzyme